MDIKKHSTKDEYDYLKHTYKTAVGAVDLYIYFFERGLLNLRDGGKLAYISPNRYLSASYGKELRSWLIDNFTIDQLIDYSDTKVFADASTYPVLSFITKQHTVNYVLKAGSIQDGNVSLNDFSSKKLTILNDNILGFLLNDKLEITEKVFDQSVSLTQAGTVNATSTAKEADEVTPLVNGAKKGVKLVNTGTIDQFLPLWGHSYLTNKGSKFIEPYLDLDNDIVTKNRKNLYCSPKIIIAKIGLNCEAFYDSQGEYASINTNCIHTFNNDFLPEYVLCWINSKLYNYTFECLFDGLRMAGGYLLYSAPNLRNTCIKQLPIQEQKRFVKLSQDMANSQSALLAKDSSFKKVIEAEFNIEKWPTKLNKWWTFNFTDFIKALRVSLTLAQKDEVLQLFEKYRINLIEIDNQIQAIDHQIDQLVYKLYGLSTDEIAIVEGNL